MERKKVLIITYYWPPVGGSGVQRWLKFTKYLREFGWEPIIYTPSNPDVALKDDTLLADIPPRIQTLKIPIWEPFEAYAKLTGRKKDEKVNPLYLQADSNPSLKDRIAVWVRGNLFLPDSRAFWIRPSVKFLTKYLKENKVDAFVTTGPPHSMHVIGLGIKKATNLPWLADFRDPWTQIGFYKELNLTSLADRLHKKWELQTLQKADSVVVVSQTMKTEIQEDIINVPIQVITNGYDSDDFIFHKPASPEKKFTILHVGVLGKPRNHECFWLGLKELLQELPNLSQNLEIHFYGKTDPEVQSSVKVHQMEAYVKFFPYLPHHQVLEVERNAGLLYLSINNTNNPKSILTGKLFEYLALKRPILGIGPTDGDAAAILNQSGAGKISAFGDIYGFKANIQYFYNQYLQGNLTVAPTGIEQFSRKNLTQKIAEELNRITSK